jgi:hypothetical protein
MPTLARAHLPFLVVLPLVGAAATPVHAQQKPDFSGTWTAVADSAAAGAPPVRLFGEEFVVRHGGQTFTIARPFGGSTMTTTHVLDGSETRSRRPGRLCEADSEFVYRAAWDGDAVRLMMVGQVPPGGGPVVKREFTWIFTMPAADTLHVEVVPAANAQGPARPASTTYKRTGVPAAREAAPAGPQPARATIGQLAWLAGVWTGTLGASEIEERWTPAAGGSMLAISRTIRAGVMNAFEFLCIVEREGGLVYTAMPNGRQPATDFVLTKIEGDSLTFENPAHDFPKTIRYSRRPDGSLEAVIAGDAKQKPISYIFKKHP